MSLLGHWNPDSVEYLNHAFWFHNFAFTVGFLFLIPVCLMYSCISYRMQKFCKKYPGWFKGEPEQAVQLEIL